MFRTPLTASHRTWTLPAAAATVALLAISACGSASPASTGSAATPPPKTTSSAPTPSGVPMPSPSGMGGGMPGMDMTSGAHHADPGKGLLAAEDGYTLVPSNKALTVGTQTVSFKIIEAASGQPVQTYTLDQTKLLHFYLVRSDLTGYVHDHPVLTKDGTWSIKVKVAQPGPYRMYADFVAKDNAGKDHPVVLSAPLTAPGAVTKAAINTSPRTQTVGGLTVAMTGPIKAGTESKVDFQVSAGGKPVTDLEQYLDSFAHMTAIHAGDLAYQHVHPELTASPGQRGGPALPFTVELPEKGTWRLFLQIQRGGALRLVPFTVTVS